MNSLNCLWNGVSCTLSLFIYDSEVLVRWVLKSYKIFTWEKRRLCHFCFPFHLITRIDQTYIIRKQGQGDKRWEMKWNTQAELMSYFRWNTLHMYFPSVMLLLIMILNTCKAELIFNKSPKNRSFHWLQPMVIFSYSVDDWYGIHFSTKCNLLKINCNDSFQWQHVLKWNM